MLKKDVINGGSYSNQDQKTQTSLNLIDIYKTARSPVNSSNLNENRNIILSPWSKKQKRAYHALKMGLKSAQKMNKKVRFLTLTTSDVQKDNIEYDEKKLNDSFRKLKQRIKRLTVAKLLKDKYIKHGDVRRYYQDISLLSPFGFEYFKVATNEGNGVIHNVNTSEYLPYNWLVDNWQDLHNSWDINIKLIRNTRKDISRTSSYVVSQYLSHQESSYQRSSQSWKWLFRGYRKAWTEFLQNCRVSYYYEPVNRKYFHHKKEVDIFKEWESRVLRIMKAQALNFRSAIQQNLFGVVVQ